MLKHTEDSTALGLGAGVTKQKQQKTTGEGGAACPVQGRGPQGGVTQFVLHPLLVGNS